MATPPTAEVRVHACGGDGRPRVPPRGLVAGGARSPSALLPIILVLVGAVLFALPGIDAPDPRRELQLTERLTEFGVIVALLGARSP